MPANLRTDRLRIGGMDCTACAARIEKALRSSNGVSSASVSYANGTAEVTYDTRFIQPSGIKAAIENLGYSVLQKSALEGSTQRADETERVIGLVAIIGALYFLISRLQLSVSLPLAEEGMGYGMLLLIGLLTSVHCVAMCGGINLSQTAVASYGSPLRASVLYNAGRVLSYTAVGAAVGAIGSVVTFGGAFRGIVQIVAGAFMVLMGVNMLGIFPWLRRLMPRMPSFIAGKAEREKAKSSSPLIVGLLNGLMPCGPLQAMQIYALSTGSPLRGAASMLAFSLGTVPLMFGLGALSSLLTKKHSRSIMSAGAVFVTVLGLVMFTQGAALSGWGNTAGNYYTPEAEGGLADSEITDGVQHVASTLESGSYPKITVQAGVPVKWTIHAPEGSINGCNKSIYIPEYGIEHTFELGENVIEFTPQDTGSFRYTCWMGMIRGTITVVDQDDPFVS